MKNKVFLENDKCVLVIKCNGGKGRDGENGNLGDTLKKNMGLEVVYRNKKGKSFMEKGVDFVL